MDSYIRSWATGAADASDDASPAEQSAHPAAADSGTSGPNTILADTRPEHTQVVGDMMPELLSVSNSSDSSDDSVRDVEMDLGADAADVDDPPLPALTAPAVTETAPPERTTADDTPRRRPRVEDVEDDDTRPRRTATPLSSAPQTPNPAPAPHAGQPQPDGATYVVQSFAFPLNANPPPTGAAPGAPAADPGAQAAQGGGAAQGNAPPAWFANMVSSIVNSITAGQVPAPDGTNQTPPGAPRVRVRSMNFGFPGNGPPRPATAPPGGAPQHARAASTAPTQADAAAQTGDDASLPTAHAQVAQLEAHLRNLETLAQDARRTLQETRAEQAAQAAHVGQALLDLFSVQPPAEPDTNATPNANGAGAPPQLIPVPIPVPFNFPFPFPLGLREEAPDDPGQAKRLIDGLEEVPTGLVRRFVRVEKETDEGGEGNCAVCWEGLDVGLDKDVNEADRAQWNVATEPPVTDVAATATQGAADAPPASQPPTSAPATQPAPTTTAAATASTGPEKAKVIVLPCSHAFHSGCLRPWFSQHTTCPNCRFNVDPDRLTSTAHVEGRRRVGVPAGDQPQMFVDFIAAMTAGAPPGTPMAQGMAHGPLLRFETGTPGAPPVAGMPPNAHGLQFRPAQPQPHPQQPPNAQPPHFDAQRDDMDADFDVEFSFGFMTANTLDPNAPQPGPGGGGIFPGQQAFTHLIQAIPPEPPGAAHPATAQQPPVNPDPTARQGPAGQAPTPAAAHTFQQMFPVAPPHPPAAQGDDGPLGPTQPAVPAAPGAAGVTVVIAPPIIHMIGAPRAVPPPMAAPSEPLPTPPPSVPLVHTPANAAAGTAPQPRVRRSRRKWARPEALGKTLRQHVEERERALGLRCASPSCSTAPTDDVPAGGRVSPSCVELGCHHTFHPGCIVSAARVAAGAVPADPAIVACPVCRVDGCVAPKAWAAGVHALEEELL